MTEDQLRDAILEALTEEIARRVAEKLQQLQKNALVICTGSALSFSTWLVGLQQLAEAGFRMDLYLSESACQVLDTEALCAAVPFGKVWKGRLEEAPEKLAASYPTILVPALTVNSAAKLAHCISDTPATRMISNSMMRGKNVVVSVDGCCPDNSDRPAMGYRMTDGLKAQLRRHLEQLQAYGASLTTADRFASRVIRTIQGPAVSAAAAPEQKAAPAPVAVPGEYRVEKRVLGRGDVSALPAACTLRVKQNCQITQLAAEVLQVRRIRVIREG